MNEPVTARQRRQLAKRVRQIHRWWNSVPVEQRRRYYSPLEITDEVGIPICVLGKALDTLGWGRGEVTIHGRKVRFWIAPGVPKPTVPRGRPLNSPRDLKGKYQ